MPPPKLESLDWQSLADVVEHPIAWDLDVFYLIGGERSESAPGAWVTQGFVRGLGIQPAIGRGFDSDAFAPGGPNVALISDRLWRTRYGADPDIVGRQFDAYVSDRPDEAEGFTIVGVMPPDFWHLNVYTEVLVPLRAATFPYMVRLREGVQPGVAIDRITALVRAGTTAPSAEWRATLESTHAAYVARLRPILRSVAVAAALVLLVALGNVAGLLLVRTTRRQKEIAVRRALGASRLAIARLLLIEGLLLSAGATIVGVLAGGLLTGWLAPVVQRELGRTAPGGAGAFTVDTPIVMAAVLGGLLAACACTVGPLVSSWRVGLVGSLQGGGRGATDGRGNQRARSVLIAVEVAASLALLAGSTLMMRSVINLLHVDFGIEANVLSVPMTLRQRTYPEPADRLAFYERALARVEAIPGVESVATTDWWPLQSPQPRVLEIDRAGARVEGRSGVIGVGPGYFATLAIPLTAGRAFSPRDRIGSEPVAIVSDTLARRMWPDGRAIGARVNVVDDGQQGERRSTTRQIIGIVRDVRQTPEDDDLADMYVPMLQSPGRFSWTYSQDGRRAADMDAAVAGGIQGDRSPDLLREGHDAADGDHAADVATKVPGVAARRVLDRRRRTGARRRVRRHRVCSPPARA